MANWFCSVVNVVCRKRLSSPRCRSELIDSAWVVIVAGQEIIKKVFSIACTQMCCIFCLLVLQICYHSLAKYVPHWLPIMLILLSNDIQSNPGPLWQNDLFNFMTWNVNSLVKDNFQRLNLIEAQNSLFDFDVISMKETSLYDTVELQDSLLDNYTFVIQQCAYQWKMEFNPDPTKQATEFLFSCKKFKPNPPPLIFNGNIVQKTSEQKHLGLILDSSISFSSHHNEKIIKAKRNIGIIKYLSTFLPFKALNQMYKALVRSHINQLLRYHL